MVKLTPDLVANSPQFMNPVREWELDLRGNKIPVIENLGCTLDQFDTIDFSDNDIRKLDGFPLLRRLKSLFLNNNRVLRISEGLEESIPSLRELILTNNSLQELGDLDSLTSLRNLTHLSLLRNPVTSRNHYRLYVIHKMPQLRILDFQRIKQKERDEATFVFGGQKGKQLEKDLGKTFSSGAAPRGKGAATKPKQSSADIAAIKKAIAEASSLAEVKRLELLLRQGQVPGKEKSGVEEEEEQEEMDTRNGRTV
eukprot:m.15994 g.15994  ORF g.15994 m.15994 type:complete len:254 (+) comp26680_c0_seq2:1098-1859(+)